LELNPNGGFYKKTKLSSFFKKKNKKVKLKVNLNFYKCVRDIKVILSIDFSIYSKVLKTDKDPGSDNFINKYLFIRDFFKRKIKII
jgi:hypothetical protein